MQKEFTHIAIIRLSALGDIVNSAIVLQFIKQAYPKIKIDWICEEAFSATLTSLKEINTIHTVNIKALKKEKSFALLSKNISALRKLPKYDVVIDMQGLLKSALVARIISKNVHGFDKNSIRESVATLFYKSSSNIKYEENIILRNVQLINDALHLNITKTMIENKKPAFEVKSSSTCKEKNVAIVIGASWKSKIYPLDKHIELINALDATCSIIWGSDKEREDAEYIINSCTNATLAPKMNLTQLIEFISMMSLVIGNDTGPTHMAWAQNVASITLFGPTNTRMIFQTKKNIAIESKSEVNILKINKNDFSIQEIDVNDVIIQAKKLLESP